MRSSWQKFKDMIFFPFRAVTLFEVDKYGLSSLQTERYDYVSKEVTGRCLDVGCGRNNRFINEFVDHGVGIDVFMYDGLTKKDIFLDMTKLPYKNEEFDTITLIANINHIPKRIRVKELSELCRILKKGGKLIVTMGNPVAEVAVHKLVWFYDKLLKTKFDVDGERGMDHDEKYYLVDDEIRGLLVKTGYGKVVKKYFWTQWGLNHLFVAEK